MIGNWTEGRLAAWLKREFPVLGAPWAPTKIRLAGTGTPEGVVTAPVGATFQRLDGGAGTCFYVKESGTGSSGWVAK